jgi:hypothetical protein
MSGFHESHVEAATRDWFATLGYSVLHGQDVAPGEPAAQRAGYGDVVLVGRLRAAIDRLNPHLPAEACDECKSPEQLDQFVQSRQFSDMLKQSLQAYTNRAITTHEVIEELIRLAKDLRDPGKRGEGLGLNDDELAFCDALSTNQSAIDVLGDRNLAIIARELVESIKQNVTIDWTIKETVRAKMRVLVKKILRKYGYPPDLQEAATTTVLEQAEVLCADWAS